MLIWNGDLRTLLPWHFCCHYVVMRYIGHGFLTTIKNSRLGINLEGAYSCPKSIPEAHVKTSYRNSPHPLNGLNNATLQAHPYAQFTPCFQGMAQRKIPQFFEQINKALVERACFQPLYVIIPLTIIQLAEPYFFFCPFFDILRRKARRFVIVVATVV